MKIVGPGILGVAALAGFLIFSGGNKENSSGASGTADRSTSSSVAQRSIGPSSTYQVNESKPLAGPQGGNSPSGAQVIPSIPVPLAPESGGTNSKAMRPSALNVPRAPNGATWPVAAGYVDGYESKDYGGSVVNLINQKTGSAFFVKLISSAQGIGTASRYVYVGAKQQFSIVNVAPGNYYLVFQDLISKKYFRTGEFSLSQGPDPLDASRLQHSIMGFEFSARGMDYLDARQISAVEFGGSKK